MLTTPVYTDSQIVLRLKPDHEKLLAFAATVEALTVPEVSPEAEPIRQQIVDSLRYFVNDIRGFAGELVRKS